eukprot:6092625-Pleurochrysis_carterae.AAC.1
MALGGGEHDVRRPSVAALLLGRVRAGRFAAVFAAPPCLSFSVAHRPALRSRAEPGGVRQVPRRWAEYLAKHNDLAESTAALVEAAAESGTPWAIENPADCGDPADMAWWPAHAPTTRRSGSSRH